MILPQNWLYSTFRTTLRNAFSEDVEEFVTYMSQQQATRSDSNSDLMSRKDLNEAPYTPASMCIEKVSKGKGIRQQYRNLRP
jgi:hypothetical protein